MTDSMKTSFPIEKLRERFGSDLQENVMLSSYTTARVGGPVEGLIVAHSADEMEKTIRILWDEGIPYTIIGGGSNVLISDSGLKGVVVLNRAHTVKIDMNQDLPCVTAESGTILSSLVHQVALRGLSGLEWALGIPGTVGGAVYGNAGAHGSDMQASLYMADILQQNGKASWSSQDMEYAYRSSKLKRNHQPVVILSARFRLSRSTPEAVQVKLDAITAKRKGSQPPGASMGSMFKNPPGDFAGRLIEDAGLKGKRIGGAEISPIHANFFINKENAKAADLYKLIRFVQAKVYERSKVRLETEIELLGDWQD